MTASIHRLRPTGWRTAEERLRDAARTLSRMPAGLATAIDVVGLDLPSSVLAAIAEDLAAEFSLMAVVERDSAVVRFER